MARKEKETVRCSVKNFTEQLVSATERTLTLSKHQPEDAFRGLIIAPSPETRRCLEQVRHMLTVREVTKKI